MSYYSEGLVSLPLIAKETEKFYTFISEFCADKLIKNILFGERIMAKQLLVKCC